jgi:hypothetical protein
MGNSAKVVRRSWLVLALVSFVGLAGSAARATAAPFVYVANSSSNAVLQYDVMGGSLSPLAAAMVATGDEPGRSRSARAARASTSPT